MFGTAALVTALSVSYYVFFRVRRETELTEQAQAAGGP
jgi:hypothetical protein